jgi:hypothetical protein
MKDRFAIRPLRPRSIPPKAGFEDPHASSVTRGPALREGKKNITAEHAETAEIFSYKK